MVIHNVQLHSNNAQFFKTFFFFKIFDCAGSSLLEDLSQVAASRGFSLVVMRGLLYVVASLAAEHRLQSGGASVVVASELQSTGSIVVLCGLRCSMARESFPDQGSNPCLLHWQADSLPLSNFFFFSHPFFFFYVLHFYLFIYFIILYWFCHTST